MRAIRSHLFAVAVMLLAANATGFLVRPGRCTCQAAGTAGCSCGKAGEAASAVECPMCKRAAQERDDSHCSARCCGGHWALPWLLDLHAVVPDRPAPAPLTTPAGIVSAADGTALEAVRPPPFPPPRHTGS